MLKKTTRITLEILMALVTALLIAAAVFLWRLSKGPMEIPILNNQIQTTLSSFSDDIDITIARTILQWGGFQHPLSVHVAGVKAINKLGGEIAGVNEISLSLSIPDLFIGRIVPTRVNVMKPSLTVTRGEDGKFDVNLKRQTKTEEEIQQNVGSDPLKEVLDLLSDTKRQGIAKKLQFFTITNSEIFYQDIPNGFTLISPRSDIELVRNENNIEGVITLNVNIGDKTEALRGQIDYDVVEQQTQISLAINEFNPEIFAQLSPKFESAKNFAVPLTGKVHIALNEFFQILSFNVVARGDKGSVIVPQFYEKPLEIEAANLDVSYNPNDGSVFIKQLAFDIDGFKADIQGRLTQSLDDNVVTLEAKAGLFNVKADQLPQYWPMGLARGARHWITSNISDAHVSKAVADVIVSAPLTDLTLVKISKLTGTILVENATVDYLNPMPAVRDVNGIATFDKDTFSVDVTSGTVRDSTIKKGTVVITDLGQHVPTIDIDLNIEGTLPDGLFLVGSKPLELTKKIGLHHDNFTGKATTDLFLSFPLLKDLKKTQVEIKAASTITDVTGKEIMGKFDVQSQKLELLADNDKMSVTGAAILSGTPIDLHWVESFGDDVQYSREMTATGQVDAAGVQKLSNIDVAQYIISPFQATAIIRETPAGVSTTAIDLDLKNTSVSLPMIGYTKSAGQDATAHFVIADDVSGNTTLNDINVDAPDLLVRGNVEFDKSVLQSLDFTQFKNNGTDVSLTATHENDRYKISVKGPFFDASDMWKKMREKEPDEKNPQDKDKDKDKAKYPAIAVSANVGTLILAEGNAGFKNVKAAIDLYPDHVHRVEMDAMAGGGQVYLRYTPFENGNGYQLRFETPDAGSALSAFGLTSKISGGTMIVDAATASNDNKMIVGGLTMKDYKIVNAPILGRLINALSPMGLLELLEGDGIRFMQLESKWHYKNDVLTFETGRMAGSSLGLNYEGSVNLKSDYMDVRGTIVPIDPLNRVVGSIPVVGVILGGKNGDGLFAATYEIKGAIQDPKVSVNPLSALAPGILRTIFFENGL